MRKYILAFTTFLVVGCSTSNIPSLGVFDNSGDENRIVNGVPVWVDNPPIKNGEVVGIGIAPRNMAGAQAQRKSAVSKAIDEIASQLGTTVNSTVTSSASVHNGSANKSMSAYSIQTVDGRVVKAVIKKTYKDRRKGILYIMMVGKVK